VSLFTFISGGMCCTYPRYKFGKICIPTHVEMQGNATSDACMPKKRSQKCHELKMQHAHKRTGSSGSHRRRACSLACRLFIFLCLPSCYPSSVVSVLLPVSSKGTTITSIPTPLLFLRPSNASIYTGLYGIQEHFSCRVVPQRPDCTICCITCILFVLLIASSFEFT